VEPIVLNPEGRRYRDRQVYDASKPIGASRLAWILRALKTCALEALEGGRLVMRFRPKEGMSSSLPALSLPISALQVLFRDSGGRGMLVPLLSAESVGTAVLLRINLNNSLRKFFRRTSLVTIEVGPSSSDLARSDRPRMFRVPSPG